MKATNEFFKKNGFVVFLFFYHMVYTFFSYSYFLKNNGDASLYWFIKELQPQNTWMNYFKYGNDFFLFLNYPFAKLFHLPIQVGFFIHSCIGFFGILLAFNLCTEIFGKQLTIKKVNLILLVFLFPNLHFWTASLGKEPLVFLLAVVIFKQIHRQSIMSISTLVCGILLLLIRPHFFLLMALSFILAYFIWSNDVLKKKLLVVSATIIGALVSIFFVLQTTKIKRIDFERIERFNDFSILSFEHANSYVPMLEYNWLNKIFAFNFRPLFFDVNHFFGFIASGENLIVAAVHFFGILGLLFYWRRIEVNFISKVVLIFAFLSTLVFVQRYACLGIFLRTKIIYQPFTTLVFLFIMVTIRKYIIVKE